MNPSIATPRNMPYAPKRVNMPVIPFENEELEESRFISLVEAGIRSPGSVSRKEVISALPSGWTEDDFEDTVLSVMMEESMNEDNDSVSIDEVLAYLRQ